MVSKAAVKERIKEVIDCGCCPVDQDAIDSIMEYFVSAMGYTDAEMTFERIDQEADLLYHYIAWTKKSGPFGEVHRSAEKV